MNATPNETMFVVKGDERNPRVKVSYEMNLATPEYDAPRVTKCRHAVLTILAHGEPAYVVYDRLLNRIIDGVYHTSVEDTLEVVATFNDPDYEWLRNDATAPNGDAMGLAYPTEEGGK